MPKKAPKQGKIYSGGYVLNPHAAPFSESYPQIIPRFDMEQLVHLHIQERKIERCMLGTSFVLYRVHPHSDVNHQQRTKIKHTLVLDNSGSMSHYTRLARDHLGCPLFDMEGCVPGTLVLFDNQAKVFDNIADSQQLTDIPFPHQGGTNITLAIQTAIAVIAKDQDLSVHHVLTFLSDGQHCDGPRLTNFDELKTQLGPRQLSIIVVGIASCDTSLGMKIKTELENVQIPGLESLYFARYHNDYDLVAGQILSGMGSFFIGGQSCELKCSGNATFLDTNTHLTRLYLRDEPQIAIVKYAGNEHPILKLDDFCIVEEAYIPFYDLQAGMQQFFNVIIPKMSQLKIAHNGNMAPVECYLSQLTDLIQCAEMAMASQHASPEPEFKVECNESYKHVDTKTRLRILQKKLRSTKMFFSAEKNRIEQLRATVQNTSSAQAAYLTGMNKKYAAKAVLRADTVNTSVESVLQKMREHILPKLKAVQSRKVFENAQTSILSCNSAKEQLEDWIAILDNPNQEFDTIYALLVGFGFVGYPVQFATRDATQMDPFQSSCLHVETVPIDSATLMFAQQMGREMRSPNSNIPMSDCLVLVDCTCPELSLITMRSEIYQFLSSCALCRDLHMYHPKQMFAMHAHAFVGCMTQYHNAPSTSGQEFITLAIKIVYSMRKYWQGFDNEENKSLFNHWFVEWNGITQSSTDQCQHPAQLVLLLACLTNSDTETKTDDDDLHVVPMLNLFSEILARNFKAWLISKSPKTDLVVPNLQKAALKLLQKLYGITPENSPRPIDDILSDEPTIESIRETCQNYAEFDNDVFTNVFGVSWTAYVNNSLMTYREAYEAALLLRNTNDLVHNMENLGDVPVDLVRDMHTHLQVVKTHPCYSDTRVLQTMLTQSLFKHDNASRAGIDDVQHPATLQAIIIDLRLVHYLEACKYKHAEYLKIIGNVSLQEGLCAGTEAFDSALGVHTHGLSYEKFWAYHQAAKQDEDKKKAFLKKSNAFVTF